MGLIDDALNGKRKKKKETLFDLYDSGEYDKRKQEKEARAKKIQEENAKKEAEKQAFLKQSAYVGPTSQKELATAVDVSGNILQGGLNAAEGVADFGRYVGADILDLVGADKKAQKVRNKAKENDVDAIVDSFQRITQGDLAGKKSREQVLEDDYIRQNSAIKDDSKFLGANVRQIFQGVGNTIGYALMSGYLGKATQGLNTAKMGGKILKGTADLAPIYMSARGSGTTEAYLDAERLGIDITDAQARWYGRLSGGIEAMTESLFGGLGKAADKLGVSKTLGLGKGALDDKLIGAFTNRFKSTLMKNLVDLGIRSTGEGVEEVLSSLFGAFAKKLTYMKDEDLGKLLKEPKYLEEFMSGTLSSLFTQAPSNVSTSIKGTETTTGITKNENKVIDAVVEERAKGKTFDKKQLNELRNEVREELMDGSLTTKEINKALGNTEISVSNEDTYLTKNYINERSAFSLNEEEQRNVKTNKQKALLDSMNKINNSGQVHKLYQTLNAIQGANDTQQYKLTTTEGLYEMGIVKKNADGQYTTIDGKPYVPRGLNNVDGTIYVNADVGSVSGTQAMYHEMFEAFKKASPKEYTNFKNMVKEIIGSEALQNEVNSYKEMYGENLTDDIMDEIINDKFGELAENENFINKLVDNRSTFEKFVDAIKKIINYIKGTPEERNLMKLKDNLEIKFAEKYKETNFAKNKRKGKQKAKQVVEAKQENIAPIKEAKTEAKKETKKQTKKESKKEAVIPTKVEADNVQGVNKIKEKYDKAKKETGNKKTIVLSDGEKLTGTYKLIESGEITPSHNSSTFEKSQYFPTTEDNTTINDRDYENDKQAQQLVKEKAQNYDGRAFNDNGIIITKDGIVVSGNDRTMAGEIAARNNTDKAYIDYLKENASQFGFTAEQIEAMNHPRVVLELDNDLNYDTNTFAKFNKDTKKTKSITEKAKEIRKTVDDDTINRVAEVLNDYEKIDDVYNSTKASKELLDLLVNKKIIDTNEIAELYDGNKFTGAGKDLIESTVLGSVINEDNLKFFRNNNDLKFKMMKSAPAILQNRTMGDYSIVDEINKAIEVYKQAQQSDMTVEQLNNQESLFGDNDFDLITKKIAETLEKKGFRNFLNFMEKYNIEASAPASGQVDMFTGDILSKEDVLRQALNIDDNTEAVAYSLVDNPEIYNEVKKYNSMEDFIFESNISYDELEAAGLGGMGEIVEYYNDKNKPILNEYKIDNNTAALTDERLQSVIDESISKWDENYARDYITTITPDQFLGLTIGEESLAKMEQQVEDLDINKLRAERQNIFLDVNMKTGKITGHEGRHRMIALKRAGINNVEIVVHPDSGTYDRYNAPRIESMDLIGQDFSVGKGTDTTIGEMIPVSKATQDELKNKDRSESNIRYSLTVSEANTGTDNNGRELSKEQKEYFKDSKITDENGNLITIYHTTTDEVAQFNEFNPVGTPYYRFGDQVVNYYSDSKEMSGSYANQKYEMADTKKTTSMEEAEKYLHDLVIKTNNKYNIKEENGKYQLIEEKRISREAKNFVNSLSENELQQMRDNIYVDREMAGTPYERAFEWDKFDEPLQAKFNNALEMYMGTAELVDLQQEIMKFVENPNLMIYDSQMEGKVIGSYDSQEELLRKFKEDIGNSNWAKNTKIQYEGYLNITNPYIVDAEGRNWNQVVQQSNKFIDDLDERVPQDVKNNLTRLYQESENISADSRDNFNAIDNAISNVNQPYLSSNLEDNIRTMNKIVSRAGFGNVELFLEGNNPNVDFWYTIASELKEAGIIDNETSRRIVDDFVVSDEIKNWLKENYTKKLNLSDFGTDKVKKIMGNEASLKDLYDKREEFYDNYDKYRYENSYFLEQLKEGNIDIGSELEDILQTRAEIMGTDSVAEEIGEAAKNGFSKPQLIRTWGTSKTTNDIVKEIIASNNNGETDYDGVIIQNVVDYGGKAEGTPEQNNVYVSFNSNQFKAADNTTPTADSDIRYSLTKMEDSELDALTKEQYEYFKNTKATTQDGELDLVHHGTPNEFNVFDIEKAGKTGLMFGNGFYFTNSQGRAEAFIGDNDNGLKSGYINIEKPASRETKTMSYNEFRNLYDALNSNPNMYLEDMGMSSIDALLSDYGDIYNDKENTIRGFYDSYDNDVNLIDNLSYMANPTEMYKTLRDITGYDGIIVRGVSEFAPYETYYIAFNPDQFKLKSNKTPTNNVDMRLSLTRADKITPRDIAPVGNNFERKYGGTQKIVQDAIAPLQEQVQNLQNSISDLKETISPTRQTLTTEETAELNQLESLGDLTEEQGERYYKLLEKRDNLAESISEPVIKMTPDDIAPTKERKVINDIENLELDISPFQDMIDRSKAIEDNIENINKNYDGIVEELTKMGIPKDAAQQTIENVVNKYDREYNASKNQDKKINKVQKMILDFKDKFSNRNAYIDKMSVDYNNDMIKYKGDLANNSFGQAKYNIEQAQTDLKGNEIGKSINQLFEDARKSGLLKAYEDYLFNKNNIERHEVGKGSTVPADVSQRLVKDYEAQYPQFKEWSKGIETYFDNLLQLEVESGLIDQSTYNLLRGEEGIYRSYVPFYPAEASKRYFDDRGQLIPVQTLKRAKGGARNIMGIQQAMSKQTMAVWNSIRTNQLYQEIVNTIGGDEGLGAIVRNEPTNLSQNLYTDTDGTKYLTAFVEGREITTKISDELYNELSRNGENKIKQLEETYKPIIKPLQWVSNLRRNMLTSYNPLFALYKNPIKDIQDATLYSKHTTGMLKNLPTSYYELLTNNTKEAKQFKALYGSAEYTGIGKGYARVSEAIELAPRFAEFKASLQAGDTVEQAIYNAREITTNFGRGGYITKALNRNGFTFLNASVQGFDKFIRNFSEQKDAKHFAMAVGKAALLGIVPAVFNHLAFGWGDDEDEEYKALPNYIKDNYYLFKMDNGEFIRIPKGRVLSVMGSAARRTLEAVEGEENAFEGYLKNAWSQIGPVELGQTPLDNTIFAPIAQATGGKKTDDGRTVGRTWYGEDLIPSRLQDEPSNEQYDEKTDKFSIWLANTELGKKLGISPKKLSYVIDQYTGGIGDVLLPTITEEASSDAETPLEYAIAPVKDQLIINATDDNKYVSNFYTKKAKLKTAQKSSEATDEDILKYKYMDSISWDMTDLYAQRRAIQSDTTLSKKEKYRQATEIKKQINALAKKGLDNYNDVQVYGDTGVVNGIRYKKGKDGKWTKQRS